MGGSRPRRHPRAGGCLPLRTLPRLCALSLADPGAAVATLLWLLSSLLVSFYVANFASYNQTFRTLGSVVVLPLWFFLPAFPGWVGAEVNLGPEGQDFRAPTTGPGRPHGRRLPVLPHR